MYCGHCLSKKKTIENFKCFQLKSQTFQYEMSGFSFDAIYILFPKLKPFLYKQFRPFPQLFSLLVMSESF